jgi:hypothetical protein
MVCRVRSTRDPYVTLERVYADGMRSQACETVRSPASVVPTTMRVLPALFLDGTLTQLNIGMHSTIARSSELPARWFSAWMEWSCWHVV